MAPNHPAFRENRPTGEEAAYGAALLLTLASVVVTIAAGGNLFGPLIAGFLQGLTLVAVLLVSGVRRSTVVALLVAAMVSATLAGVFVVRFTEPSPLAPLLWAFIVTSAIVAVGRKIRRFRVVSLQAVLGLLTAYVLLGLLFAYVDMFAAALIGRFFTSGDMRASSFVYFSYVTMATVGYGDLTPVAGVPRALAVFEAILGQLYLVSVVALAVGRFGVERRPPAE